MILLKPVRRDLVVASWLKAELSSPRFRPRVVKALHHVNLPPRAIERPNLTSRRENLLRQQALHLHRGDTWGHLPHGTQWWWAEITPREFRSLRVINYPTWTLLSRESGRLSAAATVVAQESVPAKARGRWAREARAVIIHVHQLQDRITGAEIQSQLILMGRPGGKTWTILEGNKRATALYIRCYLTKSERLPPSIHVLLGLTAEPFSCLRIP
jgi:hypothetical protein